MKEIKRFCQTPDRDPQFAYRIRLTDRDHLFTDFKRYTQ